MSLKHNLCAPIVIQSQNQCLRKTVCGMEIQLESQRIYIFSQELFVFYNLLRKNLPGISEYGFLHTLEQLSKLKGRVRLYNNIQLIML